MGLVSRTGQPLGPASDVKLSEGTASMREYIMPLLRRRKTLCAEEPWQGCPVAVVTDAPKTYCKSLPAIVADVWWEHRVQVNDGAGNVLAGPVGRDAGLKVLCAADCTHANIRAKAAATSKSPDFDMAMRVHQDIMSCLGKPPPSWADAEEAAFAKEMRSTRCRYEATVGQLFQAMLQRKSSVWQTQLADNTKAGTVAAAKASPV